MLVCKGSSFGRVAVEVTLTQPSSLPSEKNDLLFQDPRQDFELIVVTLSSHWENHRYPFYRRGPTFRVGQLSCVITWPPETNLTLRSPPPHSACCAVGSLSIVVITSQHLSYQASPPSFPGTPTSRCTHPPLPAFFFIADDILPVKMDQIGSCSGSISFLFLGQLYGISAYKQAS